MQTVGYFRSAFDRKAVERMIRIGLSSLRAQIKARISVVRAPNKGGLQDEQGKLHACQNGPFELSSKATLKICRQIPALLRSAIRAQRKGGDRDSRVNIRMLGWHCLSNGTCLIPVSAKKKFLRRITPLRRKACKAHNPGLDTSLCCCSAGQRLPQKERLLRRHQQDTDAWANCYYTYMNETNKASNNQKPETKQETRQ